MTKLDTLTGYRGGVVYAAADVLPATVHSWALEVGRARDGGHRRYSAMDAILLSLMKVLTVETGFPAARAAAVLNGNRDALTAAITTIAIEQEESKSWRWDGGPYLHIRPASSRVSRDADTAHILTDDQLAGAVADRSSGATQIIIALPRNVCRVLLSLDNVVSGNKPARRDD